MLTQMTQDDLDGSPCALERQGCQWRRTDTRVVAWDIYVQIMVTSADFTQNDRLEGEFQAKNSLDQRLETMSWLYKLKNSWCYWHVCIYVEIAHKIAKMTNLGTTF